LLLHITLAVALSLHVLYRRLQVNSALAWIVILIAMPMGAVLYVLFGDPTLGGRRLHLGQRIRRYYENAYAIAEADGPELSTIPPPFDAQARSIAQDSGFPVLSHNRYTILTDAGTILSSMVRDIDAAQSDCCLEFYHRPQRPGRSRARRCVAGGGTGVSCKILDDYGSKAFFRSPWPARLKAAGVGVPPVAGGAGQIVFEAVGFAQPSQAADL
jgi:cardiolipin synthase